jgi:hypothetical protein
MPRGEVLGNVEMTIASVGMEAPSGRCPRWFEFDQPNTGRSPRAGVAAALDRLGRARHGDLPLLVRESLLIDRSGSTILLRFASSSARRTI